MGCFAYGTISNATTTMKSVPMSWTKYMITTSFYPRGMVHAGMAHVNDPSQNNGGSSHAENEKFILVRSVTLNISAV